MGARHDVGGCETSGHAIVGAGVTVVIALRGIAALLEGTNDTAVTIRPAAALKHSTIYTSG